MLKSRLTDLENVFKLSLYGLMAVVGMILGSAESEGSTFSGNRLGIALPFLSIPMVISGYLLTERRDRSGSEAGKGLTANWANILGLAALCATVYEFTREGPERKLLAGTHLLLYATWIVLVQQKTIRLYWFLMALGILQIAVASVLTSKGWFGFCALMYMFGAVWTLSIFSLWRAEKQFSEVGGPVDPAATAKRIEKPHQKSVNFSSEVRSAVQHEDGTRWLTGRFVTGVLMTSCSALVVSAGFFAFVPRVWIGATVPISSDGDTLEGQGSRTGLSSTVRLGSLGTILESTDRVFEIRFTILKSEMRKTVSAQELAERLGMAEPLFRASVMTRYKDGQWESNPQANYEVIQSFKRQYKNVDILQEVRLDSKESGVLFCMDQPILINDLQREEFGLLNESTGIASLGDLRRKSGMLVYNVYSSLPSQIPGRYSFVVTSSAEEKYRSSEYFPKAKKVPENLTRLRKLTREIIDREIARRRSVDGPNAPRQLTKLEIANAIESHLRDSGRYKYTLDQSIRDPKIDPIEDFLFNRKEGHCEYFATALTLMLRAAGIPARLVCGYKGGVVRSDKKDWLEVQQRFAHVWVEAWFDDHAWTTFDATPADARSQSVLSVAERKGSLWEDVQSTLAGLWSDNVLNMSPDRQEKSIYKPMREFGLSLLATIRNVFTSPVSTLQSFFNDLMKREQWFSLSGGIVAFCLMSLLAGLVLLIRRCYLKIRSWLSNREARRIQKRHQFVEFYERFVNLMQARGLIRAPSQTQREFADMVASAYSPELAVDGLSDLPRQISSYFYQVRFGNQDLSESDLREIEDLLNKINRVVSNDRDNRERA